MDWGVCLVLKSVRGRWFVSNGIQTNGRIEGFAGWWSILLTSVVSGINVMADCCIKQYHWETIQWMNIFEIKVMNRNQTFILYEQYLLFDCDKCKMLFIVCVSLKRKKSKIKFQPVQISPTVDKDQIKELFYLEFYILFPFWATLKFYFFFFFFLFIYFQKNVNFF